MMDTLMEKNKTDNQPVQKEERRPALEEASTREIGGPSGPEPTRYGDWERRGRCIDF
jgi:hypothetical protein